MLNFAQLVAQLAGLIGPTIEIVKAVEAAVPPGTKGSEKLAMVKNTLVQAETVVATATPVVLAVWPVLETLISSAVAAFNASGIFRRATTAAAPATPTSAKPV